jgi:hypothetical protein
VFCDYGEEWCLLFGEILMSKYGVVLSSLVDDATVSIQILVESEMTAEQLTTYYKCKSITISDVYVEQL